MANISDEMTGATEDFKYDLNGNLIYKTNTDGSDRSLYWDESNRLRVVNDPAGMQHYIYDASGERILKANTNTEAVYGNGTLLDPANTTINSYATYPSANLVIDANGIYSKHYYAGTQRIVSRIGEKSIRIFDVELPCENCMKLQELQKTNLQQILAKGKLGQATFKPYQPYTYDEAQKALAEEDSIVKRPIFEAEKIPPLYFYHPDHLGTSTFLTDYNGNAYQFFLNLPFGETMAEQLGSNYYNTPYKFNGKELDEETGLYYYGARYYDPRVSIWLSVDPLAEKFPDHSPYVYCANNPLNMVDPTGMSEEKVDDIRFRDNDGKLIATYKTDKFDKDVVVPVSIPTETNIDLNKQLSKVGLEDVDIVGVGADWDFTAVMGGGKAIESVFFLDGKDAGKSETFVTTRQNVGWNGGAGVYCIVGDYYDDKNLKTTDYTGASFALSAGVSGPLLSSYSKFWAPKNPSNDGSGFKSLLDSSLRAWSGYNIGGGIGAGGQWSRQNTTIYNTKKK